MAQVYQYQKLGFLNRRITIISERIETYKKLRGVGPGTFFLDKKAVDKAVQEMEDELIQYNQQRQKLLSL